MPETAVRAVLWDFGGVILSSPFDAFARFENERGLPPGFLRTINATNPDTNAWAHLERGEIELERFYELFAMEARALGHEVDAKTVLSLIEGQVRPSMVAALRSVGARYKIACLTNCPSSKQMGLLSVFHKGGSGSSLFDVKPLGFDGSSGGFGWSVF